MPRTYTPREKTIPEKTARKYPCGCLVRSIKPVLNIRACNYHNMELSSGAIRTYEAALKFVETLGPDYKMVAPPRTDARQKKAKI